VILVAPVTGHADHADGTALAAVAIVAVVSLAVLAAHHQVDELGQAAHAVDVVQ